MPRFSRRDFIVSTAAAVAAASFAASAEPGRDERQMLDDWPWLGRYDADNRALLAAGTKVDTVFLGDSITEGWPRTRASFFTADRVCRGISGQTTAQMVLRMPADVLRLRPHRLHLLAGTNDIAGNTGPYSEDATYANLAMMITIARDAGIDVLLGSVPPAASFYWQPQLRPAPQIVALNRRLALLAKERGCRWLDYHHVLSDGDGAMRADFADDGVHPNASGYAAMEALCAPVIASAR